MTRKSAHELEQRSSLLYDEARKLCVAHTDSLSHEDALFVAAAMLDPFFDAFLESLIASDGIEPSAAFLAECMRDFPYAGPARRAVFRRARRLQGGENKGPQP
jgi:hypothetical protein